MNKLLFTLSLVVLVAAPGCYSLQATDFISLPDANKTEITDHLSHELIKHLIAMKPDNENNITLIINETAELTKTCIDRLMDKIQASVDHSTKDWKFVLNRYCKERSDLYNCVNILDKGVETCLYKTEIVKKDIILNYTKLLFDEGCNNEQRFRFLTNDDTTCVLNEKAKIEKCINKFSHKYIGIFTEKDVTDQINPKDHCLNILELQTCTEFALIKCTEPVQLLNDIFKKTLEKENCNISSDVNIYNVLVKQDLLTNVNKLKPENEKKIEVHIKNFLLDNVKEKCVNKTGNSESYNKIEIAFDNAKVCYQDHRDLVIEDILNELAMESNNGGTVNFTSVGLHKFCGQQGSMFACLNTFHESLHHCLTDEEIGKKNVLPRIIKRAINLLCEKENHHVIGVWDNDGITCFDDCLNRTFTKYFEPNGKLFIDEIGEVEQCQDIRDLEKCVGRDLPKCGETLPKKLVDDLFFSFIGEAGCNRHNTASAQTASIQLLMSISMAFIVKLFVF